MSFQQGLSGLNAASKSLDTIGNNVANANTVGFKAAQAQFADVYAASLTGAGASSIGIGVKVAQVAQQFTQGNITGSNNPLDVAINGNGFFRMSDGGTIIYARNGQFSFDKDGYIVNANGSRLTGYMANSAGVLSTGAPADININTADLPPVRTTAVSAILNLDSTKGLPASPFDMNDPTSYNNGTSITVYDSLGNSHVVQTFYVKTDVNEWDVYGATDGIPIGAVAAASATNPAGTVVGGVPTASTFPVAIPAGTIVINGQSVGAIAGGATAAWQGASVAQAIIDAGIANVTAAADGAGIVTITNTVPVVISINGTAATAGAASATLSALGFTAAQVGTQATTTTNLGALNFNSSGALTAAAPLSASIAVTTGAITPFTVPFDYTGTTQFGSAFSVNALTQDGYASGRLSGFNIGADGVIAGRYTNGKSNTLGQVVLASFTNPNGLQPLGSNVWAETSTSGSALVGAPNSGSLGVLQASAVEDSNVDLTAELVNMITAQRYYEANAQTIKTQDSVLQTLVNLR